ncbi:high-potential iron-sulfur protein [Blastomonas fulva]|uniref:high-potential iron-sulfur protein n=1 Tax=Blastomonas fulva TaxID=1550728 RepID=UPI000E3D232C
MPLIARRGLIAQVGLVMLAATSPSVFAQAAPARCYDPATLGLSQRNRRRSLGYVDVSGDAGKQCSECAFFTAGSGACGTCQLLTGGPVAAGGVCGSFARKPG